MSQTYLCVGTTHLIHSLETMGLTQPYIYTCLKRKSHSINNQYKYLVTKDESAISGL